MTTHALKMDPDQFEAVRNGSKTAEVRYNDRDYKVGDTLVLRETSMTLQQRTVGGDAPIPVEYTGRELQLTVTHILTGYGLRGGDVMLSFAPVVSPSQAWNDVRHQTDKLGQIGDRILRSVRILAEHQYQIGLKSTVGNEKAVELAMMIRRMAGKMAGTEMYRQAVGLLQRMGLDGTPLRAEEPAEKPIDMLIICPHCYHQHIDRDESPSDREWSAQSAGDREVQYWTNPPHRSHLCHFCNAVFRVADFATNGVATLATRGKNDSSARVYRHNKTGGMYLYIDDVTVQVDNNPLDNKNLVLYRKIETGEWFVRPVEEWRSRFTELGAPTREYVDQDR